MNDISKEIELQINRAEFFEQEHFTQKKLVEILQDQCETFRDNIKQLTDVIMSKDKEIEAMKWDFANHSDDLGMQIKHLIDEKEELKSKIEQLLPDVNLTFEEVEIQINELTKK